MHYVVGDVHGCFDELMLLLNKIEERDKEARFIFVGDFIDRGPKVMSVLRWARANITPDGEYQSVLGNHEAGVIDWYYEFLAWWKKCEAGEDSIPMPKTHYDFSKLMDGANMLTPEKLEPVIDFFKSLPYSKTIEIETVFGKKVTYRIVHAAYDYNEEKDSEKQKNSNIWERNYWGYPRNNYNDEIVIHGHTPTIDVDFLARGYMSDAPGMIGYRQNDINVDGGCCYLHSSWDAPCMLCAICLETLEEFYPYSVEERFVQMWESTVEYDSEDEYAVKMYYKERAAEFCKRYCEKEPRARKDILIKMGKETEEK